MPASTAGKGSRVFKMQKRDMTQELESGKILPLVFRLTITGGDRPAHYLPI